MTMPLDGFVADASGSVERLYPDYDELRGTRYTNALIERTGAVLMGRRSFEMADPDSYVGTYEFQVPIFVLTHHPPKVPPKRDGRLTFTFLSGDLAAVVSRAKAAAGAKDVTVVGGASVVQELLRRGLADEPWIDVMPVLLGAGLRLFEAAGLAGVRLEKIGVREVGARPSLRFRVVR